MSWSEVMIEMTRVLIDDMGATPVNSDGNLERLLVVSAFQVVQQCSFDTTFTVDIEAQTISPDPTAEATKSDSFVNLVCLRAACILDRSQASTAAKKAFVVKDGGSHYDARDVAKHRVALLEKGWCKVYNEERLAYESGQTKVAGAVVMTPFRLYAHGNLGMARSRQIMSY